MVVTNQIKACLFATNIGHQHEAHIWAQSPAAHQICADQTIANSYCHAEKSVELHVVLHNHCMILVCHQGHRIVLDQMQEG